MELAYTIVKAEKRDAPTILKLQKICYFREGALYHDFTIPPLVQTLQELEQEFSRSLFLKALYNKRIIGSVKGYVENETLYLGRLMVHPAFQRRGVGSALMASLQSHFPEASRVELFTGAKSSDNISLYTKHGFHTFKRELTEATSTELVFMEKLLKR